MIPYGCQYIAEEDVRAVTDVLHAPFLTQGPAIKKFEDAVAAYCAVPYGVAINSATSALHLACLALDLKAGDWLWTTANTFVASANCALYCGAKVDFIDIDSKTYNLSVEALAHKLVQAEKLGRLPKIVVPVHFAGQSCDMRAIYALAQKYGFHVIEDASHAIGGSYLGEKIGSCKYSDITVFSFHPVKLITTGEGGLATTKNPALFRKLSLLRSHGVTRDSTEMLEKSDESWRYEQIMLGYNYRMTDIQAALGISQLQKLDIFVARRRALAKHYQESFARIPVILPVERPDSMSAWHLYVIQLEDRQKRKEIFNKLRALGIQVNVHYMPVYSQPYYQQLGFTGGLCPQAEIYYDRAITLPIFYNLTDLDQKFIIESLVGALK